MEDEEIATTSSALGAGAIVTSSEIPNVEIESEFYNTGRIGRRNALPDILGYNSCTTTTADLPERLSALTTNDDNNKTMMEPSSSSSSGCSTSSYINRDQPSTSHAFCGGINNSQATLNSSSTSKAGTSSDDAMNNT